ncbi:MAG TPA: hypothetical protein VN753_13375 [Terracidiphilus sp.]|nr:hypothetical protein [Terracidiphilus sp.]
MTYFRGVLIGLGAVLLGTPIAIIIMAVWNSHGGTTVSFSPMGLANHLAHSASFWVLITVLFTAGFVPTVFPAKKPSSRT